MQQQTQRSQNIQPERIQSKIGKPKGMGSLKPLDRTNAWTSNQQSTQAIQTLSRLGRFICFQQTGSKKVTSDQQNQKKTKKKQISQDAPGIFLNNAQIQIPKLIGEHCQIFEKPNKNCVVFFFKSKHPEFEIKEGVPVLKQNIEKYANYPALQKLAPLLNQKFLEEYYQYLQYQEQILEEFYYYEENQNLKTAHTILQCLFTKYILKIYKNPGAEELKKIQDNLDDYYQDFQNKPETKTDVLNCLTELLACMQIEEDFDQYNEQA